jgi:hypothetical protein
MSIDFRKASRQQLEVIMFYENCPQSIKDRAYQEWSSRMTSKKVARTYGQEKSGA